VTQLSITKIIGEEDPDGLSEHPVNLMFVHLSVAAHMRIINLLILILAPFRGVWYVLGRMCLIWKWITVRVVTVCRSAEELNLAPVTVFASGDLGCHWFLLSQMEGLPFIFFSSEGGRDTARRRRRTEPLINHLIASGCFPLILVFKNAIQGPRPLTSLQ